MNQSMLVAIALCCQVPSLAWTQDAEAESKHPLEIHMKHWLAGTGQWRSPNPDYDPEAQPRTLGWVKEFGVNWAWGPNNKHLVGEVVAISAHGDTLVSSTMYAFYNPVTEKVLNVSVGRNGILELGEDRVRKEPTPYGEAEVGDVIEYLPNGAISILRHSNVFPSQGVQLSDVLKRDDDGQWSRTGQWRWVQFPESR
jgi:hypothetical protein